MLACFWWIVFLSGKGTLFSLDKLSFQVVINSAPTGCPPKKEIQVLTLLSESLMEDDQPLYDYFHEGKQSWLKKIISNNTPRLSRQGWAKRITQFKIWKCQRISCFPVQAFCLWWGRSASQIQASRRSYELGWANLGCWKNTQQIKRKPTFNQITQFPFSFITLWGWARP